MGRRQDNVVDFMYRRQLGFRNLHPLTHDLKIVRMLLASNNRQFRCIGTVRARQPITYNAGRLFTDSFTTCRSCIGDNVRKTNNFSTMYRLDRAIGGNLNDAMLFSIPYPWSTPNVSDDCPTLLRLTNTYLERLHLDTGQVIERFNFGPAAKFKFLSWNEPGFSFLLKSSKQIVRGRQAEKMTAVDFILFTVGPLAPWLVFRFSSETLRLDVGTQVSTKDFDANIDNYMLVITLNKQVRLYSLHKLIDLNPPTDLPPLYTPNVGFSRNVEIQDMPPCLMTIPTKYPEVVTFGGFPLHALYLSEDGNTYLRRVCDQTLIHVFRPSQVPIDLEAAVFANNYDDIIYWRSSNTFRIFRLADANLSQIFELECGRVKANSDSEPAPPVFSRYGRCIKKRKMADSGIELSTSVLYLAYDDDLDLLALLVLRSTIGGENFLHAEFYDSCNGKPFQNVQLQEVSEEIDDREWTLQADLTFLVLTSQRSPNEFTLSVYELLEK